MRVNSQRILCPIDLSELPVTCSITLWRWRGGGVAVNGHTAEAASWRR
jgi:hypothetical protein